MNDNRIITNTLADGSLRPIMTGEMIAEAKARRASSRHRSGRSRTSSSR